MKRVLFAAAAVCFCAPAYSFTTPAWIAETLPPGASNPHATAEHDCSGQYPAKAKGAEGVTSLDYRITEDGDVKKVTVRVSSGNTVLDKAAVACVKRWTYSPSILNEKPIEIAWRTDVKWIAPAVPASMPAITAPQRTDKPAAPDSLIQNGSAPYTDNTNTITTQKMDTPPPPPSAITSPKSTGAPHVCLEDYPLDAILEGQQGSTTVGFWITTEGHTRDVTVKKSSGFSNLDAAAITCSSRWLYTPAIKGGAAIEVPWKAIVKWSLH